MCIQTITTKTIPKDSNILFLFQAKSESGSYMGDKYSNKWKIFHISRQFNFDEDICGAWTLCGTFHYVNIGVDIAIFTLDQIEQKLLKELKIITGNRRPICTSCSSKAISIARADKVLKKSNIRTRRRRRKLHLVRHSRVFP